MRMSVSDIKKYPKLGYYVRVNMPVVINHRAVVAAIKRWGQLGKMKLQTALKWGHGPRILVKDLDVVACGGSLSSYGCTRNKNEIEIDKSTVVKFEKGKGLVKGPRKTKVYLVGAILLHELTHWADLQDGVDQDPGKEEGEEFEKAVYGGVVHD